MENYVTTITPPRQTPTHAPTYKTVRKNGEYWEITNGIKGKVTIQLGEISADIYL